MLAHLVFWGACIRGDTVVVKKALDDSRSSIDVNYPDQAGRRSLHVAASMGRLEVVKLLVAAGARFGFPDSRGQTPRSLAVQYNHEAVVEFFDSELIRRQSEGQASVQAVKLLTAAATGEVRLADPSNLFALFFMGLLCYSG